MASGPIRRDFGAQRAFVQPQGPLVLPYSRGHRQMPGTMHVLAFVSAGDVFQAGEKLRGGCHGPIAGDP